MSVSSGTIGGGRTKYKIIFLGDQLVGKSSIIEKYIRDRFEEGLNPTVGIDFHIKNVVRNNRQFRIQLWDTAGQQRFKSLIPSYMKDANCAILVYDVSKKSSLDNLKVWNNMFEDHRLPDAIKIFVGNKTDLVERQVSKKQGENFAAQYDSKHLEVSAKLGRRLDQLFNSAIDLITENLDLRNKLPAVEQRLEKQMQSSKLLSMPRPQRKMQIAVNSEVAGELEGEQEKKWRCCW